MQKELQIFAEKKPDIMSLILGEFGYIAIQTFPVTVLIGCDFFFNNLR